ncbi:TPA: hypothetical protein ACVU1I_003565 [Vibrio cholerae]|nr:hypothetical protein [Vibrio cholerae]
MKNRFVDLALLPVLVSALLYVFGLSYFAGGYGQLGISGLVVYPDFYNILVNGFYSILGGVMFQTLPSLGLLIGFVFSIYRFINGKLSVFRLSIISLVFTIGFSLVVHISSASLANQIETEAKQFLSGEIENTNYTNRVFLTYSSGKSSSVSSVDGMLLSSSGDFLIIITVDSTKVIPKKNVTEISLP